MMPLYMNVKVRQTTTPGTTCPTLYEECVGSLTSHRFITCARACEKGPMVYRPYPRLRKGLRINLHPQGSFATFLLLGNANAYFFTIVHNGGFKGGQWTPRTDIEPNFAKLSAKPFFSTAFNFQTSGSGTRVGAWLGARGICRPSIYSVSRAPPTYSTDDWGDLSHSYLKIITINIKLRFKDRKFSRDDFFVTGLSAACAVCFTVQ